MNSAAVAAIMPSMGQITPLAEVFFRSGRFKDIRNVAQACVQILAGAEMGLGPMASMQGIYMVDGKPTLGANLIAGMVKRSGRYNYRVREITNEVCRLEFFENGESCGESKFTMADAKEASLGNKGPWKSYPRNMLFARAMTNGARWYCPDVFGGITVLTPDEAGAEIAMGPDGEITVLAPPDKPPAAIAAVDDDAAVPQMPVLVKLHEQLGTPDGSLSEWLENQKIVPGILARDPMRLTDDEKIAVRAVLREKIAALEAPPEGEYEDPNDAFAAASEPQPVRPTGPPQRREGEPQIGGPTRAALMALLGARGVKERDDRLHWAHENGIDVKSFNDLTELQAQYLCKRAELMPKVAS